MHKIGKSLEANGFIEIMAESFGNLGVATSEQKILTQLATDLLEQNRYQWGLEDKCRATSEGKILGEIKLTIDSSNSRRTALTVSYTHLTLPTTPYV